MNCSRPKRQTFALSLLLLPALACGAADEAPADNPAASASDHTPAETGPALPRFIAQEGWIEEEPSSGMRMLQFRLPGDGDGLDTELAVASWPNGVGALEENLDRWVTQVGLETPAAQLSAEQRWTDDVRDFVVTTIYIQGDVGPMDGATGETAPIANGAMMAAFIEKLGKSHVWTVKATGPSVTLEKHKAAIQAFLRGL